MYDKQNVILILVDQWRGDCIDMFGRTDAKTPFINELAQDSVTFTSAYAAAPSCIPARACLITGQTPYSCGRIGYRDHIPWDYKGTMVEGLRDKGYQTINVGKTHYYPHRAHLGFEINHLYEPSTYDGFKSDYHKWLNRESKGMVEDTAVTYEGNLWMTFPWDGMAALHPTNWTVQKGIEALEHRDPTRPFFMQLSFHRPHPPYDAPQFYVDMYDDVALREVPVGDWVSDDERTFRTNAHRGKLKHSDTERMRKGYYASVSHVDAQIGRFIHWLKVNGLYDDAYIVFTSDHGELLGDHHMYRKINPWEGSAKIPLIMKGPHSTANTRVNKNDTHDAPCSHMDILPTLYEELGIAIPDKVDGSSLSQALRGGGLNDRHFLHGEHTGYGDEGWQFIVDERFKYIWDTFSGKEWFFDLHDDPDEMTNLIDCKEMADKIDGYRERLIGVLAERPEYGLTDGKRLISGKRLPDYIER